jgi:hypothetical protein
MYFLYLARELNELVRARNEPSRAGFLARYTNEPERAEPSWLVIPL